jgi:hypothetical protein
MATTTDQNFEAFQWQPQPAAAAFVHDLLSAFANGSSDIARFAERLTNETGTRLLDWVDHFGLPADDRIQTRLEQAGFARHGSAMTWRHPAGLFPDVMLNEERVSRLAIRVESVADFLAAQGLENHLTIEGQPLHPLRKARIAAQDGMEFWAVERHGYRGWETRDISEEQIDAVVHFEDTFWRRPRHFDDAAQGFAAARELVEAAVAALGTGRASDLFFSVERQYWTGRNRAAQFQFSRQLALGLGWANHDHHTYRSSREQFCRLIAFLEVLGFDCRERFYAGRAAGWGAQVLEQEESQVVIFADVDLSADEVVEDFAHAPLPRRAEFGTVAFGTVGLWCLLHGEAFLEAGMHHLECRFDYEAARKQLEQAGIGVMSPFTDFSFLKQAFTEAEPWKVEPHRAEAALAAGAITPEQAARFRDVGALGSHLEILQRDDGYKGFNQTGINEIIRATDPRGAHGTAPIQA